VIEQEMKFYHSFGPSECRLSEQGQAEEDNGTIQRKQFICEPIFIFPLSYTPPRMGIIEEMSKKLLGFMGISIGESVFLGCIYNLLELFQAAG
jgi:hypothetical protein